MSKTKKKKPSPKSKERTIPLKSSREPVLPPSDIIPYVPHVVPINPGWACIIGDTHIPFHAKNGIETAIMQAKRNACKTFILNGDIVDFYSISRHPKRAKSKKMQDEIAMVKQLFEYARYHLKNAEIVYKPGNHCNRFYSYISANCGEFEGLLSLQEMMGMKDYGIVEVKDDRPISFGEYLIFHGHELSRSFSPPNNPAKTALDKTNANVIVSHHHKTSNNVQPVGIGGFIKAHSLGCLCDLNFDYARVNAWNHGFAMLECFQGGEIEVRNLVIQDGKIQ